LMIVGYTLVGGVVETVTSTVGGWAKAMTKPATCR